MRRPRPFAPTLAAALLITFAALSAGVATPAAAQRDRDARDSRSDREWCDQSYGGSRDRETHCEVRELTLDARRVLRVDGRTNGGVQVRGWDRDEISVRARVQAQARSLAAARDIVADVRIEDGDVLRADGPTRLGRDEHWSVSYEIMVPHRTDLQLEARNGGLTVREVEGRMELRTMNGGLHVTDVAGDVRGRTTNGGVTAELTGTRWDGAGLDLQTTNGGVRLLLPRDYSATLETGTVNGGMNIDFPVTIQGRLDHRRIRTEIGRGGPLVRVTTTNGGVTVGRGR
jgi:hypothetical protein